MPFVVIVVSVLFVDFCHSHVCGRVANRVAPDLIFSDLAGARFGIADLAGAGAECS